MKRIDELDSPLNTTKELETYLGRVRELHRDLYMDLSFAAEVIQQNLSTLPVADSKAGAFGATHSRVRARKVARCLRRAADANKYAGAQAVKTWREFIRSFAPEIEMIRNGGKKTQPKFEL